MTASPDKRLRSLPSVDEALRASIGRLAAERYGRLAATAAVRTALGEARAALRAVEGAAPNAEAIAATALSRLEMRDVPALSPVLNLTGTVLHTNLGRALLAEAAIEAAVAAMRGAVALEFDLCTGRRGERDDHLRGLVCDLTGAEDATFVNNNAAAVLLTLNTLAGGGRGAVVSRGELIEIGGAFRMPDIMARAGARLIEVGTTNRTHLRDYADALDMETGVVLKVHTSNYRIEGFTGEVGARALAGLARPRGVPLLHDLGSGSLVDLTQFGLGREPTVAEAVADGADLVTFSGDKILGGPQAGFIVGRHDLVAAVNRNPMKRALRVDKIRIAALEATLKLYRDPDRLASRLPTLRLLSRKRVELEALARQLAPQTAAAVGEAYVVTVTDCACQIGSGALPLETIPSAGLAIAPRATGGAAIERLAAAFRRLPTPVIGRIEHGRLILDLRCLDDALGFTDNLARLRLEDSNALA
jgi:L-seryl-tRNA(Ser) seleniumtransferase